MLKGVSSSEIEHCTICDDRCALRTPDGLVSCQCVEQRTMLMSMDTRLRPFGLKQLPVEYQGLRPWPLRPLRVQGPVTYDQFRFMCWRSLQQRFLTSGFTHEFMAPRRLNEIYFGKDNDYKTLGELSSATVLVFNLAPTVRNEAMGTLLSELISERVDTHTALWLYQGMAGNALASMYGEYVQEALDRMPVVRTLGEAVPAPPMR